MEFDSSNILQHPREKLPQPAISVLDTTPDVNFQYGRFFTTTQGFETRLNFITFHYWKIEIFCKFVKNNTDIVINKGFICGDVKVFSHLLEKCFVNGVCNDPKGIFKKVCLNFPFEFLLMLDLFRDHCC